MEPLQQHWDLYDLDAHDLDATAENLPELNLNAPNQGPVSPQRQPGQSPKKKKRKKRAIANENVSDAVMPQVPVIIPDLVEQAQVSVDTPLLVAKTVGYELGCVLEYRRLFGIHRGNREAHEHLVLMQQYQEVKRSTLNDRLKQLTKFTDEELKAFIATESESKFSTWKKKHQ